MGFQSDEAISLQVKQEMAMGDLDFLKKRTFEFSGWTLEIFKIIIELGEIDFSLREIYAFESSLKKIYPLNNTIQDQIRKQLQILKKKGVLKSDDNGHYSVIRKC